MNYMKTYIPLLRINIVLNEIMHYEPEALIHNKEIINT